LWDIDSFKDIDLDDPPDGIEQYLDSGVVIKMGKIEVRGVTVREILAEENIKFYKHDNLGEVTATIEASEPVFHPVGQSKAQIDSDDDDNDNDTESEVLDVFNGIAEYRSIDELNND
jgi:hypothetical protein